MVENLTKIFAEIMADPQNETYTQAGIEPLYYANPQAKLLIIGQAPGKKAQDSRIVWNDPSGDRLRSWLAVDRQTFYESGQVAVLPMDFYFPGSGKSGDLPPRKGFAQKWHPRLLAAMPNIQLTILVGAYATKHYLNLKASTKLTMVVKNYQEYLPAYFPLVHPSPRNQIWLKKNPWFEAEVIPALQGRVAKILRQN
ncbi:uracil-DNA glycosylase family protein [Ligilactobacillus agilis]|uniref:uracil-DNA glycosylase family protein n=1 Tax=Ligilactobacillus agilis TaxID=1601 RepID=UPI00254CEF14|nr:uracil-DNA glycosylase family protein [Ligilactobacillus agilis]MDK6809073.1 uracil-DNA glycosylase family protein [Ligilactobacillus agilis]